MGGDVSLGERFSIDREGMIRSVFPLSFSWGSDRACGIRAPRWESWSLLGFERLSGAFRVVAILRAGGGGQW